MIILIDDFDPSILPTSKANFQRITPKQAKEILEKDASARSASLAASQKLGVELLNYLGDSIRLNEGDSAILLSKNHFYQITPF